MAISDKLTYLNTTKSQLKDMINYGLDDNKITSSTTFRNYVSSIKEAFLEALRNPDTLFTNLPKKSGTGSNITLNDTANAPMRIELGATELTQAGTPTPSSPQDIHTISGSNTIKVIGKNYFHISSATPVANSTCNIISDNAISITNLNNQNYRYATIPIEVEANTTYYFKANVSNSNSSVTNVWFSVWNENKTATLLDTSYTSETTKKFNTGSNTKLSVGIYATGGGGLSNTATWSEIQLTKANNDTYEPYVSQEADIDLKSKNLLDNILTTQTLNGITAKRNNDGSITLNGTATAQTDFSFLNTRLDFENGTYTFSISKVGNNNVSIQYGVSGYGIMDTGTAKTSYTTTFPNTSMGTSYSYINMFRVRITNGAVLNNYTIYPMIEKGSVATNYVSFYDYGEYCKIGNYEDKFIRNSGKNLFDKNSVENNKRLDGSGQPITSDATGFSLTGYIKVKPNTQYTYSRNLTSSSYYVNVCEYTSDKTFIQRLYSAGDTTTTYKFTTPNNCEYLRINDATTNLNSIQLEIGDTATEYEPYGSNEWYIKKNIGKVVLNANENWTIYTATSKPVFYYDTSTSTNKIEYLKQSGLTCYSNYYLGKGEVSSFDDVYDLGNYSIAFRTMYDRLVIRNDDITTVEDFKTWLSTHNTEVYYVLATPTYTPITGTLAEQLENVYKNMLSQKGTTNISQVNNDLAFNLNVSAIEE